MTTQIDFQKLLFFMLKRIWLIILCAAIGFGGMFWYAENRIPDTYTAYATLYVYSANTNVVNYQYANASDLTTAVKLMETYQVVIRSNKVLNAVVERLGTNLSTSYLSSTLAMGSVSNTGVMRLTCTTRDPELSQEICNAVADIAPAEIIRVVGAGSVEVVDYAELPLVPNSHRTRERSMRGALYGAVLAAGVLFLLFIFNRKLTDSKELTDNYNLPLLASIPKQPPQEDRHDALLSKHSSSQLLAAYGKLRMNAMFATEGRIKTILISSSIPGEGKSTIASNLAVSFAMDGAKVLLVDCDMRKPTQGLIFPVKEGAAGLSNMLIGMRQKDEVLMREVLPGLDVMPAGTIPPNPSELLHSSIMQTFLIEAEQEYDRIILDMPPINVVTDSLSLSSIETGMIFVTRCNYSDHREIQKALADAEFSKINLLGMVMNCAHRSSDGYYNYRYYNRYYHAYDTNKQPSKKSVFDFLKKGKRNR